ncbi:MAG: hypothetical protein ACJAUP_003182 [Cellvibrionaceae bacterium]
MAAGSANNSGTDLITLLGDDSEMVSDAALDNKKLNSLMNIYSVGLNSMAHLY